MTTSSIPFDLQQFQSLLQGCTSQEEVKFEAGQVLPCSAGDHLRVTCPQQGMLVAQQSLQGSWIDAGLLGPGDVWVMSGQESVTWQFRALCSGWTNAATGQADALAHSCEQLLQWQFRQQQQVALWAHCRQNHALPQRLATWLSLIRDEAAVCVGNHWCEVLNLQPHFFQAALQALASTGSIWLAGEEVKVLQAEMLARQACSCLEAWRCR